MNKSIEEINEIIQMAWCDKTSFEDIKQLTGVSEPEVIELMRRQLKKSSFNMWRKRVSGRQMKHKKKLDIKRMAIPNIENNQATDETQEEDIIE